MLADNIRGRGAFAVLALLVVSLPLSVETPGWPLVAARSIRLLRAIVWCCRMGMRVVSLLGGA